jgi:hypothetical protein
MNTIIDEATIGRGEPNIRIIISRHGSRFFWRMGARHSGMPTHVWAEGVSHARHTWQVKLEMRQAFRQKYGTKE